MWEAKKRAKCLIWLEGGGRRLRCTLEKPPSTSIVIVQTIRAAAMALVNVWHLRKVAEASAKPCDVCYKPTTSVLITPDNKVGHIS